jgi:hypothetical protein
MFRKEPSSGISQFSPATVHSGGPAQLSGSGAIASKDAVDSAPSAHHGRPDAAPHGPKWNRVARKLFVNGVLVRTYRRHPARNQTAVLDAFEAAYWAEAIENPIRNDQLGQTLYALNTSMSPKLIRFRGTGDGSICWDWISPPR